MSYRLMHRIPLWHHSNYIENTKNNARYGNAKYLRDALPNASFIGFTGTPIETSGEKKLVKKTLLAREKELANQGIDFNNYSNMNVIAQQKIADMMGKTTDELTDQLLKQQYLGITKQRFEFFRL